jgi:hypothetical protein
VAIKNGRTYQLRVQIGQDLTNFLVIELPFTIEFDITRNMIGSACHSVIRIFNLSKKNRALIRFDQNSFGVFRNVVLLAGYGDQQSVVFKGNMTQAWSVREGTNFVTQIECYDGGEAFTNSKINLPVPANTVTKNVILSLIKSLNIPDLGNITIGTVGSFPKPFPKGKAISGNTAENLVRLSGKGFFIDQGVAHCLGDNECRQGVLDTIDDSVGIIGTPILEFTFVNVEMIFEPRLVLGQLVQLNSKQVDDLTPGNPFIPKRNQFNKAYKIVGITQKGMISASIAGDATTKVQLSPGTGSLTVVLP